MKDFNVGDTLKMKEVLPSCPVGSVVTVVAADNPIEGYFVSQTEVSQAWANLHKDYFEVVARQFDFKTDPWYIHIHTKEHYEAVKDWLAKAHKINDIPVEWRDGGLYLTNIYLDDDKTVKRVLWSSTKDGVSPKAQRICLQFRTKIEVVQVTYPKPVLVKEETESQRLLKELQQQIAELQAKANQLEQVTNLNKKLKTGSREASERNQTRLDW